MTDWIVENRPEKPAIDQPSLRDLGKAVAEAAGVATGLWLSYLFALFYMLVAAAGVTNRDLFLESGIKLPFLSVELPLQGFFVLGPAILLIVHAYLLLHFVLFADKARSFVRRKLAEPRGDAAQELLPVNFVLQMVAAPADWSRPAELVATVIVWITLVFYPVLVLMFFELQFLPFHSEWITWWHRAAVVLDLLLLWWLWPKITCVNQTEPPRKLRRWFERGALGLWSLAACYLVFLVATWSGERLESLLPFLPLPLHETLVAGRVDDEQLRPSSPWSNRLVLAGADLLDHAKYDSSAKLATAPALYSFRGRHLERAVLTEATLPRADFTAAHLEGASFIRARAQGAWFDRSELEGADLSEAQLQGASFYLAHMPATSLKNASMQGARMASADLEGAWFEGADLTAASLGGSNLRYAVFDGADLRGASLDDVRLQGASLQKTKLEGAWLDTAYIWQTDFRGAEFGSSGLWVGALSPLPGGPPCTDSCERVEPPELIRSMAVRYADPYTQTHLLGWLQPELGLGSRGWTPEAAGLNRLQSVTLTDNENALSDLWGRMVCFGSGAPFVVETLIATAAETHWTRPRYREGMIRLINHLLTDKDCAAGPAVTDTTKIQVLDLPLMRQPELSTRTADGTQ